jgi:hypothetical protein
MTATTARWFPRFGLRSLLVVVLLAAVLLGWYADHRRQAEALRRAQVEIEIYERQTEQLKMLLAQSGAGMRMIFLWASADDFIQALIDTDDENEFYGIAGSLGSSDETVMDEAVQRLITLLADPNERTRSRSVITLRFLKEQSHTQVLPGSQTVLEQIQSRYADAITRGLVPLLDNRQPSGAEAYYALRAYGPDARAALEVLREKMADDSNYYAAQAAEAVHAIDPTTDIGPRLIELIEKQHPDWQTAAAALGKHVPPAEARRVLTALYDRLENESDRQVVISSLNSIPVTK